MTFDTDNKDVGDVIGGPPAQLQEGRLDWSHMEEAEEIKLDNEYSDYIGEAQEAFNTEMTMFAMAICGIGMVLAWNFMRKRSYEKDENLMQ